MIEFLTTLSKLYFAPLQLFVLFSPPAFISYTTKVLELTVMNAVIEILAMYLFLTVITNPPSFLELSKPVFIANLKSLLIAKLFHNLFVLAIGFLPLAGEILKGSGFYIEIVIAIVLDYFFIRQQFNSMFEEGKLDHEQMGDDLFFAVVIANLCVFAIHFTLKSGLL